MGDVTPEVLLKFIDVLVFEILNHKLQNSWPRC